MRPLATKMAQYVDKPVFVGSLVGGMALVILTVAWLGGEQVPVERPSTDSADAEATMEEREPASGVSQDQHMANGQEGQAKPRTTKARKVSRNPRRAAFAQAENGWQLIQDGEYQEAEGAFTQATMVVADEASFFLGLGLSQHLLARNHLAANALERAVELDPSVREAHTLLGNVYEDRGELALAIRHYEHALKQDPNDVGLQARLQGAKRESRANAGYDRLFSAHFVVTFPGPAQRRAARRVADQLDLVYKEIGRRLEYFPDAAITVVLSHERQFREVTASPEWARGLFDGKIRLSIDGVSGKTSETRSTLRHEYTHAVVHRLSSGRAPTWLDEGLAMYFEGRAANRRRDVLVQHIQERMPLTSLHGSFLGLPPRAAAEAYLESYGATRELIRRHGLRRVRQLLEALRKTPDFSAAFEMVLQERYSDFDTGWIEPESTGRS
ncbi:MAG: tetratricopeptide repeat protein [Nitrospiraceae bacterium]